MPLKDILLENIPERFHQEPDCKALFQIVHFNKFNDITELRAYLDKEVKETEGWLKNNSSTGAQAVIHIRDNVIKLETMKRCREYVEKYC